MFSKIKSIGLLGLESYMIDVEANVTSGKFNIEINKKDLTQKININGLDNYVLISSYKKRIFLIFFSILF